MVDSGGNARSGSSAFPPLVGRARESQALQRAFQRALDGEGGLVLVSGEAGIGKTSLVQAFTREAAGQDLLILRGYCYDLSTTPPYGLWLELTDRYPERDDLPPVPDVLRRGTGIGDLPHQMALFEAAGDFLAALARQHPLVVVLEDVHWADQASLDLLRYLARHLEGQRILLIATYRDDEITRKHPLFSLLPSLVRETQATRIELNALDRNSVRALVTERWILPAADHDRLVAYLLAHAEGNPLFTVELLRTLEHGNFVRQSGDGCHLTNLRGVPVPTLAHQVIEGRMAQLGEEARHFLEVAAVIGHEVPLEVWQAVAGMTDRDVLAVLDQATNLHLLEEISEEGTIQFVHALTREALYSGIVLPRRRIWHRLVAESLATAANSVPDTVAHHFQQAADPRAIEWLIRAGEWAQHTFAWRVAVDRFRSASDILELDESRIRERAWLRYRAARHSLYLDPAGGVADLDEALRIATHTEDAVLWAASLVRRGHLLSFTGDTQTSIDQMTQGVTAWDDLPLSEKLSCEYIDVVGADPHVNVFRGTLLLISGWSGRFHECLHQAETFLPEMESARKRLLAERHIYWLDGYVGIGRAHSAMGNPQGARELLEDARAGFAAIGIPVMESFSIFSIVRDVHIPYQTDRLDDRRRLADEMDDAWKRSSGAIRPEMLSRLQHIHLLALQGDWAEVNDLANRGMNWHANASRQIELRAAAGPVARYQGNPGFAWEQVTAALPDGPSTEPGTAGFFFEALELVSLAVHLTHDAGNYESARAWLATHDRWMEWSGAIRGRADNRLLWARHYLVTGDAATARQYAEEAERLATDPRQPGTLIAVHRFLGELAIQDHDIDSADQHLKQSLQLAEACAIPIERALTMLAVAELELIRGDQAAARTHLGEVRRISSDLGARPTLERVEALSARLRPGEIDSRFGLSPREREVLALLVLGQRDKEIAEDLFISNRTVMQHVSSILRKLDVDSRTAATAKAIRHELS